MVFASHGAAFDGGAQRSLLDLAVRLERDGRVEPVVTVPRAGAMADALRAASIPSVALPTPPWTWPSRGTSQRRPLEDLSGRSRRALGIARHTRPWVRWLRSQRPDVVVTNTATIATPALASTFVGIPHVWWLRELVAESHGLRYLFGTRPSQRSIGWLSTAVVANSWAVADHYSPPIRRNKVLVIYPGIEVPDAGSNVFDPPALRVLLLGRQTPAKGTQTAFEALRTLEPEPMRIELRLVGPIDAEYRAELKRLASALGIAARVHIVGPTPTTHDQLAWANVVLMCSENEGFGRVTAEALKSGRPVIGARSGATTELISDGVNGLLVAPRSADELAGALRRIATEPGLIAQMSENARTGARDRFTVESELESFLEVLTAAATFRA